MIFSLWYLTFEKKNSTLEAKNQKLEEENRAQKDALVRLQSLNEQLVCLRKRMFGQSSEKIEYVDCKQLDFFNEAEVFVVADQRQSCLKQQPAQLSPTALLQIFL